MNKVATTSSISFSATEITKSMYMDKLLGGSETKRILQNLQDEADLSVHPILAIARQLPTSRKTNKKLSLDELCEWYALHADLSYFHIDPLKIDIARVSNVVAHDYAKRHGFLPVEDSIGSVTLAVKNPFDLHWKDELEQLLRKEIRIAFSNPNDIDRYLNEFYSLAKSIDRSRLGDSSQASLPQGLDQLLELGRGGQLDAEDHHVVQVVDWLLQYAFEQRASDIHLEPRSERGEIRFRIDGVLHNVYEVPPNVMMAIIGRIKTLGRMDIAEKRRPLDGRLKTRTPDGKDIELRLSTIPTASGEKMVMRIFDPEVLQRSFAELGIANRELRLWQKLTGHTNGIILVTGPTGSGKTTTLYSTLRQLATSEVNVCTIEDPIEMIEPVFNQMQANTGIGLNFAQGVKALLRQDPDIMMIGEIRDLDTAEMAIQAALTGHLVLSTLHTNDAVSAVTRLMELGVPAYLINATVLGVMAQRLVRTLCPECKKPFEVDSSKWQEFAGDLEVPADQAAQAEGCLECRQTGFSGRVGIYEMLEFTPQFQELVRQGAELSELREQAAKDGLLSLRQNGALHVANGRTTIEEVLRVTPFS
jgi:general secretion pathway protein E